MSNYDRVEVTKYRLLRFLNREDLFNQPNPTRVRALVEAMKEAMKEAKIRVDVFFTKASDNQVAVVGELGRPFYVPFRSPEGPRVYSWQDPADMALTEELLGNPTTWTPVQEQEEG